MKKNKPIKRSKIKNLKKGDRVWVEGRRLYVDEITDLDDNDVPSFCTDKVYGGLNTYGQRWRVWTKCPTEKERRNAKWEEADRITTH